MTQENDLRQDIVEACLEMNANGLNQGTSGNISVRFEDQLLISPSATPYSKLTKDMIVSMDLSGQMTGKWQGPRKPSTEWRFHWMLMKERADVTAVIHAHPPFCTTLAVLRKSIPACHYMIAAFGGIDIRCSGYATFGSPELAGMAFEALKDRTACLLANHGMVTVGTGLEQTMWRAVELETIACQYWQALLAGDPIILSKSEIDDTSAMFSNYGVQPR